MDYAACWQDIESKIRSKRVLITCHDRPDEDAIYSVVSFCLILDQLDIKYFVTLSNDNIPFLVELITGQFEFRKTIDRSPNAEKYDVLVVLDTGDPKLLNRKDHLVEKFKEQNKVILNIDHHAQNHQYGTFNFVDSTSSAACELLFQFLKSASHLKFTPDIAHALLGGILGDTVILKASNVTSTTLRIAADLIDLGARRMSLVESMPTIQSIEIAKIWGRILSSINFINDGLNIAYFIIDQEIQDFIESRGGIHSLISFIRDIKGVDVALSFKPEFDVGEIKVSFRSKSNIDVGIIASTLGGGGHRNSAGCTIKSNSIDEAVLLVLNATRNATL